MNDVALPGLGLKQAVEILAGCVGAMNLTVFVHPNFSPYQPPRSQNAILTNILPMPVSLESSFVESSYSTPSNSRPVPTPHPSLKTSTTTQAPPLPTYENLQRSSVPGQYRKKYVVYFVEICRGFYHPEGLFFGRLSPEKF